MSWSRAALAFSLLAGCTVFDDGESLLGTGGAGATAATTTGMTSTGTMAGPCNSDAVCDTDEGCDCADCLMTTVCDPFFCNPNGTCEPTEACICADCDHDFQFACADPTKPNCLTNDVCSPLEGCFCLDCQTRPECVDNIAECKGGAIDGLCEAGMDGCLCPDCAATPNCVPCTPNGECGFNEGCHCEDCEAQPFCLECQNSAPDGICNDFEEGCNCADCAGFAVCL